MNHIEFKNIVRQVDGILGVEYDNAKINALELSNYLKDNLEAKSIDYKIFNSNDSFNKATVDNPPRGIYEYQNFFLLRHKSEYILMDGFRRLLWYNVPEIDINVRIYDADMLSNKDMLSLMVNLNHFKFFSKSSYHDRGFGLFLKTIFDLTISNYIAALDGYLSYNQTKRDWLHEIVDGNDKNRTIQERIVNDHFVNDMEFIERIAEKGAMVNKFTGSLIYSIRTSTNEPFDSDKFIEAHNGITALQPLLSKYGVVGHTRGGESEKVTNQILEIYGNIMTTILGGKTVKSYAEKLVDCRGLTEQMRKDKNLIKLTNSGYGQELELIIKQKIEAGENVEFKCVIYPVDSKSPILESGLNERINFIEWRKIYYRGTKDVAATLPIFGISNGDHIFKIEHNTGFSNWRSNITKYWAKLCQRGDIKIGRGEHHNIELFVVMPQSILKKLKDAR